MNKLIKTAKAAIAGCWLGISATGALSFIPSFPVSIGVITVFAGLGGLSLGIYQLLHA